MAGSIYALVALGFVLIYRCSLILNLAQGEFLLFGAYICWSGLALFHVPLLIALALTFGFAIILGLLVERFALRPLSGQPVVSIIMMTIGLSYLMRGFATLVWSGSLHVLPRLFPEVPIQLGNIPLSQPHFWSFIIVLFLFFFFFLFFKFTRVGLAMRAIAEDQQAAQGAGIRINSIFALIWGFAALVAAIGGILIGSISGISLNLADMGLQVLAVPLLGGLESIRGVIVAGPLIGIAENLAAGYLDPFVGGGFKEVASFIIMVIILLIRPQGLFGLKRTDRV